MRYMTSGAAWTSTGETDGADAPYRAGANNYVGNSKGITDFDLITAKVDYRISDKQNIFGRFMF